MASVVLNADAGYDQLYANGVLTGAAGVVSDGAGSFRNSLNLVGVPTVPSAPGPAQNELLLNGAYLRMNANTFTAPQTAASTATIELLDAATPQLQIAMNQTAPLFPAGAVALNMYATANTAAADSVVVSRPFVSSQPQNYPTGSAASLSPNGGGAHTQVAAADVIACPTVTATSIFRTWLAGLTGIVGATAVLPATISAITPGTGFTLNGTIGAIYGYELLYA